MCETDESVSQMNVSRVVSPNPAQGNRLIEIRSPFSVLSAALAEPRSAVHPFHGLLLGSATNEIERQAVRQDSIRRNSPKYERYFEGLFR
jgi:hypothetical protein